MATKYWMISNRNVEGSGAKRDLGRDRGTLRFFTADGADRLDVLSNWREVSADSFQKSLATVADRFPQVDETRNEDQKHVTIFIHGYNNDWKAAVGRYKQIVEELFNANDLGICILFTWPSDGVVYDYLPDRKDARESANDLADVLSRLYDWLIDKQVACAQDPAETCKAKTSVIAHSMGNYVLQCAMNAVWTRKNRPLLVSLINQLLMVAADVDNDLFKDGEDVGQADGEGIANLTYRVTALYSGRDSVLGTSAGLKHFGKRRLGRSGIDRKYAVPDNVWDADCSSFFADNERNIHSAYFSSPKAMELMRQALRGIDRGVLVDRGIAPNEEGVVVAPATVAGVA